MEAAEPVYSPAAVKAAFLHRFASYVAWPGEPTSDDPFTIAVSGADEVGNRLKGETYGVEGWADVQVTPWWRLSPGFRSLRKDLQFKEGAIRLLGVEQGGNDPRWRAYLKSSMNLRADITLDAFAHYVDELPDPATDSYLELSMRLAWDVSPAWQISLSGFNLLHERHVEYAPPTGMQIQRSFFIEARWRN